MHEELWNFKELVLALTDRIEIETRSTTIDANANLELCKSQLEMTRQEKNELLRQNSLHINEIRRLSESTADADQKQVATLQRLHKYKCKLKEEKAVSEKAYDDLERVSNELRAEIRGLKEQL